MGNSEDEESDFEGFSLHQVNGDGDESDVGLDLVVNSDCVLATFDLESEVSQELSKRMLLRVTWSCLLLLGPAKEKQTKEEVEKRGDCNEN